LSGDDNVTTKKAPPKQEPPTPAPAPKSNKATKVTIENVSKRPICMPDETILGTALDAHLIESGKAHPVKAEFDKSDVDKWVTHPVVGKLFDNELRVR
jgi:hypothetical protein